MNASFSILQKLKNQFLQSIPNSTDFHVAFAPFAFTMSTDDFYFLKHESQTGDEARKYLKEQSEFSFTSNSVLRKPNIWTVDSDNLLYNAYKSILDNARVIDPDVLTTEETMQLNAAKDILFDADNNDSVEYKSYRTYSVRYTDIERQLIDQAELKNTIPQTDKAAFDRWNIDFVNLNNQKKELLIEWQVKGSKSKIESAKSAYDSIVFGKSEFVEKWNDAKNNKFTSNQLTDNFGVEFLTTTCIPNSICDYQSPIWKKITIPKAEIAQLTKSFTDEVPANVLEEFGNIEPELDSISFEYCIIDIIRPWFDEALINNRFWKFADSGALVSAGDDSMTGQIPAYPAKIILAKNIDLIFTPNSRVNEDIKNKLKLGNRLFFGSLMLKTIPANIDDKKLNSYRIQQLSNKELSVITKVAFHNVSTTKKINDNSKFKMIELLNQRSNKQVFKNVQVKSVNNMRLNTKHSRGVVLPTKVVKVKGSRVKLPPGKVTVAKKTTVGFTPLIIKKQLLHINPKVIKNMTINPPPPPPPVDKTSDITGKIFDNKNNPVPVAEIQIMNISNATTQSVLSQEDGTYGFAGIENDAYQFTVRKTGYLTIEKNITIRTDSNQDFLLLKQPIPTETFQVLGVICKKLPRLPNPLPDGIYI